MEGFWKGGGEKEGTWVLRCRGVYDEMGEETELLFGQKLKHQPLLKG